MSETQIQSADWQFVNSDLREVHSHSFLDINVNPDIIGFRNIWASGGDGATERSETEAIFFIQGKSQVGKATDIEENDRKVRNVILSLKKKWSV